MSTLTDFLLARIAEDEAAAVCGHGPGCPNQDFEFSPGLTDCNQLNLGPNRWRAECEAKRRIVERCRASNGYWGYDVERFLALPYADHPDYREEWKP